MREDPNDTQTPPATFPADPAEGQQDIDLPGADTPEPPKDKEDELPKRLGERIEREPVGIATGEPDLGPNVDVPDAQM